MRPSSASGCLHGGQRRRHDGRLLRVVEADDREILGDAQPALARDLDRADRHVVVRGEDRGRRLGEVEQRRCGRRRPP